MVLIIARNFYKIKLVEIDKKIINCNVFIVFKFLDLSIVIELVLIPASDYPDQAELTAVSSCHHLVSVEESGWSPVLRFGITLSSFFNIFNKRQIDPCHIYARGWPSLVRGKINRRSSCGRNTCTRVSPVFFFLIIF